MAGTQGTPDREATGKAPSITTKGRKGTTKNQNMKSIWLKSGPCTRQLPRRTWHKWGTPLPSSTRAQARSKMMGSTETPPASSNPLRKPIDATKTSQARTGTLSPIDRAAQSQISTGAVASHPNSKRGHHSKIKSRAQIPIFHRPVAWAKGNPRTCQILINRRNSTSFS